MEKSKKLKLTDYEISVTLGAGAFGRVKLARNKTNNLWRALKILKKAEMVKMK